MIWSRFIDPLFYLCLTGSMVTSWPLTQEVAGSNYYINYKYFWSLISVNLRKWKCFVMKYRFHLRSIQKDARICYRPIFFLQILPLPQNYKYYSVLELSRY